MPKSLMTTLRAVWKAEDALAWLQEALVVLREDSRSSLAAKDRRAAVRRYARELEKARKLLAKLPDELPDDLG